MVSVPYLVLVENLQVYHVKTSLILHEIIGKEKSIFSFSQDFYIQLTYT